MPLSLFRAQAVISDVLNLNCSASARSRGAAAALSDDLRHPGESPRSQVYIRQTARGVSYRLQDDKHLVNHRIVSMVGGASRVPSPMVDAAADGSAHVNTIIPPLRSAAPRCRSAVSRTDRLGEADLVTRDSLTAPMLEFHRRRPSRPAPTSSCREAPAQARLSRFAQRAVDVHRRPRASSRSRDAAELICCDSGVVRLETRPPNIEGQGRGSAT